MQRPINPLELPTDPPSRIPLSKASSYPVGGVYGLWSDAGELLYVGQTASVAGRLVQHRKDPKKSEAVTFCFVAIDKLLERLVTETVEIVRWRPRLNKAVLLRVSSGGLSEIRWKR